MELNKERPILFSTQMVQAILDGRKTQTRRVVKGTALQWLNDGFTPEFVADKVNSLSRYGYAGDVLWVRETWARVNDSQGRFSHYTYSDQEPLHSMLKWKPSIHMPKQACRLFLLVKDVRIERLHDITEQDAIAEGIQFEFDKGYNQVMYHHYLCSENGYALDAEHSFETLWQSINGEQSWDANPWVWVVEFERMERRSI